MIPQRWSIHNSPAFLTLLAVLVLPAAAQRLHAQSPELSGQVVDPAGLPVAGITVSLHRVTDSGGAEVGRAISDQEGRFAIGLEGASDGGVFFAATRFDGTLYMGEPFRTLAEAPTAYRIVIGSGGIAGGAAQQAPGRPADRQGWVILLFTVLGVTAVALPFWRSRRGPRALRTLLADLAELEEDLAALPVEARATAEGEYLVAREALRTRLRALSGARTHAADLH